MGEETVPLTGGENASSLQISSPFNRLEDVDHGYRGLQRWLHAGQREDASLALEDQFKDMGEYDVTPFSEGQILQQKDQDLPVNTNMATHPSSLLQSPLLPTTPGLNGLYFTSTHAALSSIPTPPWLCPHPDPSIPTTPSTTQTWILHLTTALTNTTNTHDSPSPTFHKHWLAQPPFYPRATLEHLAWSLLALTTALHTRGPAVLHLADRTQALHVARTRDWTFAQRMGAMVALLAGSKARCEKCIQRVNLGMVVGNPEKLLRGTRENKVQNGKRQVWLEKAREGRRRGWVGGG